MKKIIAAIYVLLILLNIYIIKRLNDCIKILKPVVNERVEYDSLKRQYKWMTPEYYYCVINACDKYDVFPVIVFSLIESESNGKQNATNKKTKDAGIMQISPVHKIVDVYNPEVNINFGVKYLSQLIRKAGGNYHQALMMYNAGPNRKKYYNNKYADKIIARVVESQIERP